MNLSLILREEEKAIFWVNIYHVLMLHAHAEMGPAASTRSLAKILNSAAYNIGGHVISLNEIHHCILRAPLPPPKAPSSLPSMSAPHFSKKDPRHALALRSPIPLLSVLLNCGSQSCPKIRILNPKSFGEDLLSAAHHFLETHLDIRSSGSVYHVTIPRVIAWYSADFGKDKSQILQTLLPYVTPKSQLARDLLSIVSNEKEMKKYKVKVEPADYEWRFHCDLSIAAQQLQQDAK